MVTLEDVKLIIGEVLQLGPRVNQLDHHSGLLGSVPEFDSMAVVYVITAIEENFDLVINDDEISAEDFETLGSLHRFISKKLGES
jgi:acyl carrier protein